MGSTQVQQCSTRRSMAERQQCRTVGFKSIQLFKDQALGIGSYGKVCKAKCDDLLCAVKLLHETLLLDPTVYQLVASHQREHRLPVRRFEQECEFLSTIRHPNIVQYLGIYRDPDSSLPALLMELMDNSLTHFLESSPQPIPYHIQVNICHDITLALSFLHSNGIVHRDLSSNNVLLIGNVRAKVTDFGMASLGDQNLQTTQLTFTMCPGTDVYMPPEAVQDKPVYTEKIDCFSFGVITTQIITRQFPKPGDRRKKIQLNQPGLPPTVEVSVSEIERRQSHINEIDPNHSLLPITLDYLKDKDIERPSAQQLCERVAAIKEDPQYNESVKIVVKARNTTEKDRSDAKDSELRSLREQHSQQIQGLQQIIQSQTSRLEEKDQVLVQKDVTIATGQQQLGQQINENRELEREKNRAIEEKMRLEGQLEQKDEAIAAEQQQLRYQITKVNQLEREMNQAIEEKERLERELGRVNQQLEEIELVTAQFQRHITELEQLRGPATDTTPRSKQQKTSIKLTWREGEKAPYKLGYCRYAAVDGKILYIRKWTHEVYAYTISTSTWSQLPNSPTESCPSVIINNLLTLVGGNKLSGKLTNKLFSLTGEGSNRRWTEEFPPMPTKRWESTAICSGTPLMIVAGGMNKQRFTLRVVEVLNTETLQWTTATDLPQPLSHAPAAICDDQIYILGALSTYTCSLVTLIQSRKPLLPSLGNKGSGIWKEVAATPFPHTTCVSVHSQLLTIGGKDSERKPATAIHMYNPTTDSWEVISYMITPRYDCIAAVLPNNQLMIVGGFNIAGDETSDSVELAAIMIH